MLSSAEKILKRVAAAIGQGIEYLVSQVSVGIGYITDLISGKKMGDLAAAVS